MLKSFFDPNGAFARGMERVWSLIVLNVLWLVCSLPVVTMGASCAALRNLDLLTVLEGLLHGVRGR